MKDAPREYVVYDKETGWCLVPDDKLSIEGEFKYLRHHHPGDDTMFVRKDDKKCIRCGKVAPDKFIILNNLMEMK